jgi:hypothetical protein
LSRAEIEREGGRPEPDRLLLARTVRGVAAAADSEADFVARLRDQGVRVRPRYGKGGKNEVAGYSAAMPNRRYAESVWFGGGKLSRDLTLPRLRERWLDGPDQRRQAITAWWQSAGTLPVPAVPRVPAAYDKNTWIAATEVLAEIREQLLAVPANDHATWAGVAREVSGILSIWSLQIEGTRPGHLAAVADALAKASRTRHDEPHPRVPQDAKMFRMVAKVVSTTAKETSGQWAQIHLLAQILRFIQAIEEVGRARTHALEAIAGASASLQQLHELTGFTVTR